MSKRTNKTKPMPEYTMEQKAAAFDTLWRNCGPGSGNIKDWVSRNISRPGCPINEATIMRVPRYEFVILCEGEFHKFRDVLHYLANKKDGIDVDSAKGIDQESVA